MDILLIQYGSPENLLFITPIMRTLKTELDANIDVLTDHEGSLLLNENPYVNRTIDLDQKKAVRSNLKSKRYDYAVDFKNSFKSKMLRRGVSKTMLSFKGEGFKRWIYSKTKINLLSKKHLIDQYFDLLTSLGVRPDQLGLDFYIPEKDQVELEWLPKSHQNGYASVIIDAAFETRKLPTNRLIELCDRINKPIVLIGSESNVDVANEIEEFFRRGTDAEESAIEDLNKNAVVFNACGKFSFNQSASLIKQSTWVFTHENIYMHIAASYKKKLYTIWGNTSPLFGRYPYQSQFTVFENNKLDCRPCSSKGFSNCPKGHFKCMNDLTFDFYLPD